MRTSWQNQFGRKAPGHISDAADQFRGFLELYRSSDLVRATGEDAMSDDPDFPKANHALQVLRQARLSRNEAAAIMLGDLVYEIAGTGFRTVEIEARQDAWLAISALAKTIQAEGFASPALWKAALGATESWIELLDQPLRSGFLRSPGGTKHDLRRSFSGARSAKDELQKMSDVPSSGDRGPSDYNCGRTNVGARPMAGGRRRYVPVPAAGSGAEILSGSKSSAGHRSNRTQPIPRDAHSGADRLIVYVNQ